MESIININISAYNNLFDNLELIIKKNKISAISGPNNCGKTTLIKILDRTIKTKNMIKLNNLYIEQYTSKEYNAKVQSVIPRYNTFHENTLKEELLYQQINEEKINFLIKIFRISRLSKKNINNFNDQEFVLAQIIDAIAKSQNLVIIDSIDEYFNSDELKKLYTNFYKCINKYNLTFIITCTNLESTIYTNELFILDKGKVKINNSPLKVLENDNILNKIGLELPFMVDLSVKLKDYNLIKEIELDSNNMIEELWK